MPRSTQRVLPVDLIDELDDALDLIAAVADLLALATLGAAAGDPTHLRGETVARAASFIESEALRLRGLIQRRGQIPTPNPSTAPDDAA